MSQYSLVLMSMPVSTSHKHTVLSYDTETSMLPSGEKTTEVSISLWPSNADPMAVPLSTSHKCTVVSSDADASWLPSGQKTTELTDELWPSRADPMAVPVSTSHKHTVIRCRGQLAPIW